MRANQELLLERATRARERAYAPYSNYRVGAAVATAAGNVYTGCNVENASYGLTICAERAAIFSAVAQGERNIVAIAVVAAGDASMCGACRQVMREFGEDITVYLSRQGGACHTTTVADLLPGSFNADSLKEGESL